VFGGFIYFEQEQEQEQDVYEYWRQVDRGDVLIWDDDDEDHDDDMTILRLLMRRKISGSTITIQRHSLAKDKHNTVGCVLKSDLC
jgi:CRISPR/Cas system CMR-associated protein Cmr3 (group 5 of RAMP superfamily)